jgi:hypothetical protein
MDPNPPFLITGYQGWYPVIKRGGLGSIYQAGKVGMNLSRGEGWDPFIKREGLGSIYQEGKVGINLLRGEGWYPS